MSVGQAAPFDQLIFDWNQSGPYLESQNEPWVEQVDQGGEVSFDSFFNIPVHSPRRHYQVHDEFRTIGLNAALENLRAGRFERSTLWLYDTNGLEARSYNGVMSASRAHNVLQRKPHWQSNRRVNGPTPFERQCFRIPYPHRFFLESHQRPKELRFNSVQLCDHLDHNVLEDCRKKADGTPWRKSRNLSFLCTETQSGAQMVDVLHETQHSFTVYGSNKSTWTSNCLIDTYFYEHDPENQDTVEYYAEEEELDDADVDHPVWDPSTIGNLEAKKVSRDPCNFFLEVLSNRFVQLHEEWMNIFTTVQGGISTFIELHPATTVAIPTSQKCSLEALTKIEKSRNWLQQTEELLEFLICTLDNIITCFNNDFLDTFMNFTPRTRRISLLLQQIRHKVESYKRILRGFMELRTQCDHYRRDLILYIDMMGGHVIALQNLNANFLQVMAPVVVAAAIIQARILPFGLEVQAFWFLVVSFFALNWFIQPDLIPLTKWRQRIVDARNTAITSPIRLFEVLTPSCYGESQTGGNRTQQHLGRGLMADYMNDKFQPSQKRGDSGDQNLKNPIASPSLRPDKEHSEAQPVSSVDVMGEQRTWDEASPERTERVEQGLTRGSRLIIMASTILSFLGLREKDVPAHHQRIRWTNPLGHKLYDDYIEHEPDALRSLQEHLNGVPQSSGSSSHSRHLSSSSRSSTSSNDSSPHTPSSEYTTSIELVQENNIHKTMPDGSNGDLETGQKSPRSLHLMFCVENGRYGAKLHQLPATDLADDRQLFRLLRDSYRKLRGRWRPYWSLRTVQSIQFMKFGYGGPQHIDVRCHYEICEKGKACQCLPPARLVCPQGIEYECSPVPAKLSPPIGPNLMMDYFANPDNPAPDSTLILQQIPKRACGELPDPNSAPTTGVMEAWGIYIQEDWDWGKIWTILGMAFFPPSLLFGILWGVLKNDIQGAFGVASWWMTAGTILVGIIGTCGLKF
ncbi:hypothetical protein BGZ63DRAFT_466933 [Mariannaea sp. PMI_226]|nr:hypothetical protein BGZ63DRAFT_466933 [Mariannaea sp. PMI_226]